MSDPFVIPVPPGATEIDLRPVLLPIIRALLNHHSARDREPATLSGTTGWIGRAFYEHALHERIARLRPDWIAAVVRRDGGWEFDRWDGGGDLLFRRPIPGADPGGAYWERYLEVRLPNRHPMTSEQLGWWIRSVKTLAGTRNRTVEKTLDEIEAEGNPVDRIALLA